jgi:divinyl protochlorophyllide a 8-vinyl-reductase
MNAMAGAAVLPGAGRIGPNAITRMAEALMASEGMAATRALFAEAGLTAHLATPPTSMVPEREVMQLHRTLRAGLGEARAGLVSREAGRLTAYYLLAHRIPHPVQWLLRRLPPGPAAWILLRAIGRHAWTFAGSGRFRVLPGRPLRLEIAEGPLALGAQAENPVCAYYAATFETLFAELVSPRTRVAEVVCMALGAPACVFEVDWSRDSH